MSTRRTAKATHKGHKGNTKEMPGGQFGRCITMSYMKTSAVTIRFDPKVQRELDRACKRVRKSRSEYVRDAVQRQLRLERFEQARAALVPLAEAKGILTDEDVFRIVSYWHCASSSTRTC